MVAVIDRVALEHVLAESVCRLRAPVLSESSYTSIKSFAVSKFGNFLHTIRMKVQ